MSEPLLNPRNQNWEVIAQKISTPTGAIGTTGYLTLNPANGVKINTLAGPTGSTNPSLFYDTTTKEITYSTSPAPATPTLSAVMGAGNSASTTLNMNTNAISNITTATATTFIGALSGNATSATTATTSTNIAGGAGGSIPYQTASATTALLANGTSGQYLKSNGGTLAPSWTSFASVSYSCNVLTNNNVKGTGTGKYIQIGNFIQVQAVVAFSSTGDANGIVALSLPSVVTTGTSNTAFYGNFGFIRSGVAWYFGNGAIINAGSISGIANGSADYMGVSTPTVTMQVGDIVSMSCCFFI
jgi:hypothetical protein